jgi:hypothetical protein
VEQCISSLKDLRQLLIEPLVEEAAGVEDELTWQSLTTESSSRSTPQVNDENTGVDLVKWRKLTDDKRQSGSLRMTSKVNNGLICRQGQPSASTNREPTNKSVTFSIPPSVKSSSFGMREIARASKVEIPGLIPW